MKRLRAILSILIIQAILVGCGGQNGAQLTTNFVLCVSYIGLDE